MSELYFAGIDAGSTYVKAALIRGNQIIGTEIANSGINNTAAASALLDTLAQKNGIKREEIAYTMATGYSRKIIDCADADVSEITAHAYGAKLTAPSGFQPGLLIDIGGQDNKIIYLDSNYSVVNFSMNDKCAAGTGRFIRTCAQLLETTVGEMGQLSLESKEPCQINSTCVVFAQSEIISLIARKYDRRDIIAGLHLSMARRIIKMIRRSEVNGDIMLTGSGALNVGLKKAFEDELLRDVFVASDPQYNGAIGAARFAAEQYRG